jgi:hypothetical protein
MAALIHGTGMRITECTNPVQAPVRLTEESGGGAMRLRGDLGRCGVGEAMAMLLGSPEYFTLRVGPDDNQ